MLDLKNLFKSLKLFQSNKQEKVLEPKKLVCDKDHWKESVFEYKEYSACFVDGSLITPSRHFGNWNFGFTCAVAVLLDYKNKGFDNFTISKVEDLSNINLEAQGFSQKLSNSMLELELSVFFQERVVDFSTIFFDMSLDYLLSQALKKTLSFDLKKHLNKICSSKTAIFYTSNPSKEILKNQFKNTFENCLCSQNLKKPSWILLEKKEINLDGLIAFRSSFLVSTNGFELNELALVEILSTSNNELEGLAKVFDQLKKGSGYPRGLALAHNLCSIGAKEGQFFHQMINLKSKNNVSAKQSQKEMSNYNK